MSSISEWVKDELYPAIFDKLEGALPELHLKRSRTGWMSKHYLSGEPHPSREDKVKIREKSPGWIFEEGGTGKTLVSYVMDRDSLPFMDTVKKLAEIAGVKIPGGSSYDPEEYRKYKDRTSILEDANQYFIFCLENSPGAQEVRDYLEGRGYSPEDVKAMELGYIPSQEKLFTYLTGRGYNKTLQEEVLQLNSRIGDSHNLTIPYRSGGSLKGFKFRTTGATMPKYLNSSGLEKAGGFFNLSSLRGDKDRDLVIVEGELDALHATAKGVKNVVATAGSSVSPGQVQEAIKKGARIFTLCFDNEPGQEDETVNRVNRAIKVIRDEGVNRIYIATLPDLDGHKTDPDRLLKEKGAHAFTEAVAQALPYYTYQLQGILHRYGKIQDEGRDLTSKEKDSLLDEVVKTGATLDPMDRDQYKKLFTSIPAIQELGITGESYQIAVDELTTTTAKEKQARALRDLLAEVKRHQESGETDKAINLMGQSLGSIRIQDREAEFNKLLAPVTEEGVKDRLSKKPDSIFTGYTIEGEGLYIPSGALSVFSAPTSHGKTTFLINLALNIARQGKEIYLFSFEEDGDTMLTYVLNSYMGIELSRGNRKSLRSYFSTGSTEYINRDAVELFNDYKNRFFKEMVETRKINVIYTSYDSQTLIDAIRYIQKNANPGAILIDYIQLLSLPTRVKTERKINARQEELKEICISLKDLAVDTGLPIILGAQFNRDVVNPLLLHSTKIGEAGDIERIANLIVGFWNNDFEPLGKPGELDIIESKGMNKPGTLYVKILKNRGGLVRLQDNLQWNGNTQVIGETRLPGSSGVKDTPPPRETERQRRFF